MPSLLAPRYWGAHLLMLLALAAATGLGFWQLEAWQAGRAADARDLTGAAPLPLAEVMGGDDPFPGRYLGQPVSFTGTWLPEGTLYVADRDLGGRRGYWVMTPVLIGSSAMPVVRGWAEQPRAPRPQGEVEVEGWLQASEGTGRTDEDPRDRVIPEMRIPTVVQYVEADLYSGYVVSRDATAGLVAVTPDSVPEVSRVSHLRNLLYAFQWWVFGGFAVYIWVRWLRDTWQEQASPEQVASSA